MSTDVLVSDRSASETPNVDRIPPLVDVDAHVVEPADVWSSRLPARYREIGPHIEYHPAGTPVLAGGTYIEEPGTEGPDRGLVVLRGPPLLGEAPHRRRRLPRRRDRLPGHHVRPDAPGVLAAGGPPRRHGRSTASRRSSATRTTRASPARSSCTARTRSSPCCACRPTTTGWSRSGAAPAAGASSRCAWSRSGTPSSPPQEVRRNAARGVRAVAFSELPAYLGLPSIYCGYWEPFFQACAETGTVICMHIGSGTKTPQRLRDCARRGRRDDHLRQQRREPHRLHARRACCTATPT